MFAGISKDADGQTGEIRLLDERDRVRVNKLKDQYLDRGYEVLTDPVLHSGVDLIVVEKKTATIVEAVKSTNWGKTGACMTDISFDHILSSLNWFDRVGSGRVRKRLVVSYRENLSRVPYKDGLSEEETRVIEREKLLADSGIEFTVLGYQEEVDHEPIREFPT